MEYRLLSMYNHWAGRVVSISFTFHTPGPPHDLEGGGLSPHSLPPPLYTPLPTTQPDFILFGKRFLELKSKLPHY